MNVTLIIILLTGVVSVLAFNNHELFDRLKFSAYDAKHSNQWYRFITYGFIHAGWFHLFVNMFVLYSFGNIVETLYRYYFPSKHLLYFLILYIGALMLSITPAFGKNKNNVFYNAVGASGAVAAIVFASIILHPTGKIYFVFVPFGISAPIFGILYIAYEYYMSRRANDNIGHDAHIWGAIYGVILTIALKPELGLMFLNQIGLRI